MKALAYIGAFTLGLLAGVPVTISLVTLGLARRVDNPVDDTAIYFEDEYTKIVRLNNEGECKSVDVLAIVHKDRI